MKRKVHKFGSFLCFLQKVNWCWKYTRLENAQKQICSVWPSSIWMVAMGNYSPSSFSVRLKPRQGEDLPREQEGSKREESSKQKIFKEGIISQAGDAGSSLILHINCKFPLHCCWVQLTSLVFPAVALVILPSICEADISSAVMTFFPPRLWQCFLGMTSF